MFLFDFLLLFPDNRILSVIGDVRNKQRVESQVKQYRPDIIFHAAAYKHVPLMEEYPCEAVRANVLGTQNVADVAVDCGVEKFIMISTDKAVHPSSVMGATKHIAEMYVQSLGNKIKSGGLKGKTCFITTRFGNVLGSNGSVIPLFCDQIAAGKPLTVTNPDMTRFMMTLEDAVDLVLYAFEHGNQGDLFVQKAPAATLSTLAQALKEVYSRVDPKYGETEVRVIGTRHGEKLYETLVTREEMAKAIDMGKYYRIPCDTRDLNYDKYFTEGNEDVSKIEDYHSHNTQRLNVDEMKELLLRLRFIREDLGLLPKAKAKDIRSE